MFEATFQGIRFIEGRPPNCRLLGEVSVEIGGLFTSSQLKSLDDVKRELASEIKRRGGNALVDFKYGQRSVGMMASLFSRDDVSWYGKGIVANV